MRRFLSALSLIYILFTPSLMGSHHDLPLDILAGTFPLSPFPFAPFLSFYLPLLFFSSSPPLSLSKRIVTSGSWHRQKTVKLWVWHMCLLGSCREFCSGSSRLGEDLGCLLTALLLLFASECSERVLLLNAIRPLPPHANSILSES